MPSKIIKIEQHGIDAIPKVERKKSGWDFFVMLAAINITFPSFLIGGLIVPGLSWAAAFWALILGYLILGILIALMSYMGVDFGIPASVVSRFSLGYPKGTWLSSFFIIISLIGWFAVTAELAGLAVNDLMKSFTGYSSPTLIIIIVGMSNAISAIIGFECIKWLSRLSVPLLLGLSVWLLIAIEKTYDITLLVQYKPTGDISFITALDWIIGGLIVGVYISSDISRYVRSRTDTWFGSILGVLPASVFLGVLGILAKLATGDWNPVNAVQNLGLGIPALIIIIFSTWTTNDSNLYSAGLALTNILPRLSRWQNTMVLSIMGTIIAALRISNHFDTFLEILNYAFCPLVGIVLFDYFLIKKTKLNLSELYKSKGQLYYFRGINIVAWIIVVIGFFIAFFTPSNILKSVTAIISSGVLYYFAVRFFDFLNLEKLRPQ